MSYDATIDIVSMPVSVAQELSDHLGSSFRVCKHPDDRSLLSVPSLAMPGCRIIYDWSDGRGSLNLIRALRRQEIPSSVILIVTEQNVDVAGFAARAGATRVLPASLNTQRLAEVTREVVLIDEKERVTWEKKRGVIDRFRKLSPSELAVLSMLLEGCSNRVIANRLDVSQRTVEGRRSKIFRKTKTECPVQVARLVDWVEDRLDFLDIPSIHEIPSNH